LGLISSSGSIHIYYQLLESFVIIYHPINFGERRGVWPLGMSSVWMEGNMGENGIGNLGVTVLDMVLSAIEMYQKIVQWFAVFSQSDY
jgi:hypothetical protein